MKRFSEGAYYVLSGALMALGSLFSENGGRQHPIVSQSMGRYGSPGFFFNFAKMIVDDHHWMPIHVQIMAGPVLWILGSVALATLVRSAGGRRWAALAVTALAMGATLWVVTYIFDGFVAPQTAPYVLHGSGPLLPAFRDTFGGLQWVAIRTSFAAWLLIAFGTGAMSAALAGLIRKAVGLGRALIVVMVTLGAFLTGWSVVATATGAYLPGPMDSGWYLPSLVGTQWWFIMGGLLVIYAAVIRPHALEGRLAAPEQMPDPVPVS
jgi:hypothetical protein